VHSLGMPTDSTHKKRADAHFKKEARQAEASQASGDYVAQQKAAHNQLKKLREERLARETTQGTRKEEE
jgi:hypothetical protein